MAKKDDESSLLGGFFLLVLMTFCLGWKGALAVLLGLVGFYLLYVTVVLGGAVLIGLAALVLLVALAGVGGNKEYRGAVPSTQPISQLER